MKKNSVVRVKYIGEDNPLSLRYGKIYEARVLQKGWFGVVDETNEEYAYVDGKDMEAEVHWFQEPSVGKHRFKVKKWLDD